MSEFSVTIEEYMVFDSWSEGSVNFPGVAYSVVLTEEVNISEQSFLAQMEEVFDSFIVTDDFAASHEPWCYLSETFNLELRSGRRARVGQSILNVVHSAEVEPVDVFWVGLEVLHGVDFYYEEVSSGLHQIDYDVVSHKYWSYCYESLNLKFENGDINKIYACYKAVNMSTEDRINLRHSVVQEYYFNSKAFDYFFTWDTPAFGWHKALADGFKVDHSIKGAYGRKVYEAITPALTLSANWTGQQILDARIFMYDQAIFEKFYAKLLEESFGLALSMDVDARMVHTALEALSLSETLDPSFQRFLEAVERLAVSTALRVTFGQQPEIVEALEVQGHPEILRAIPQVLSDMITLLDDPVAKWLAMVAIDEATNLSDEAMR